MNDPCILIVDDEPLARMRLKSMLKHLNFEQIIEAKHGAQGVELASSQMPDLIFMDIEMPELDGIKAAAEIKLQHPSMPIIFSTAHDEFALQAFDLSAADYILKPLSLDRLKQAIEKVGLNFINDKIQVKRGNDVIRLAVSDIICLMAEDKYVIAHLHQQTFLLDQSLAEFENEFSGFLRIHRNALINTAHLKGIHHCPGQAPQALLNNLTLQPNISRRQLPLVKKLLKEL